MRIQTGRQKPTTQAQTRYRVTAKLRLLLFPCVFTVDTMLSGGLDISNTAPLHLRAGGGTKQERLLIAVCRSFHPPTLPLSAIGPTTTHWC